MIFNCQRRSRTHRTLRRCIGAGVDDIDAPIYQRGQRETAGRYQLAEIEAKQRKRARKRRRKGAEKREREAADAIIACIVLA